MRHVALNLLGIFISSLLTNKEHGKVFLWSLNLYSKGTRALFHCIESNFVLALVWFTAPCDWIKRNSRHSQTIIQIYLHRPIVICSHAFSRAWASSCDCFIVIDYFSVDTQ